VRLIVLPTKHNCFTTKHNLKEEELVSYIDFPSPSDTFGILTVHCVLYQVCSFQCLTVLVSEVDRLVYFVLKGIDCGFKCKYMSSLVFVYGI
jgi:hypothetical protein